MPTVNDFIDAIAAGNLANANTMFGELMQDRLSQALDDKKIELAQGMLGIEAEASEEEDTDLEDTEENAEVQGVSGSD